MDACMRLVAYLNRAGGSWGDPQPGVREGEYQLRAATDPGRRLDVQVLEDLEDSPFWRNLARDREVVWVGTTSALAALVRQSIQRAVRERPVDADARPLRVIAVTGGDAPVLALNSVAEAFRRRHGAWARSLGYHGIWLVGRDDEQILRLDPGDQTPAEGHPAPAPE